MAVLLDTEAVPVRQRAELFASVVSGASSTNRVSFAGRPEDVRGLMRLVDFGTARVFDVDASGNTLLRTPRVARAEGGPWLALAVVVHGRSRLRVGREETHLQSRDMLLSDLSEPYEFGWEGMAGSYAFQVDADVLGLPRDVVHAARTRIRDAPLYPLVRDHVEFVTTHADALEHDPGAADLVTATIDLMRALIVSAAGPTGLRREVGHQTLTARIEAYVRAHCRDPALGPEQVAAAHALSVRQLYRVLAAAEVSLEQVILGQRLDGARRDLLAPGSAHRTVAAVARAWGFDNPSFFGVRFRRAYGTTPGRYRRRHGGGP